MDKVKAKKFLGQHFLKDEQIAFKITDSLILDGSFKNVLEIGPGMGVLTKYLFEKHAQNLSVSEIDRESVAYLKHHFPELKIIEGDFLRYDLKALIDGNCAIIGNLPYNISSQIFFRVLEYKDNIPQVVSMIQKEVAERLASKHGNKDYGILSVLLQAFYDIDYLFTVHEHVFQPPPRVKSAVIRLRRNNRKELLCSEKIFFRVVKQSFSTRRKTLRNALKPLNLPIEITSEEIFNLRAEQLSVEDFVQFAAKLAPYIK